MDESDEKDSFSPNKVRKELIVYLLRNYEGLTVKDISEVLGQKPRTIRRDLNRLKESGFVEKERLGKEYIWSLIEDGEGESIYF